MGVRRRQAWRIAALLAVMTLTATACGAGGGDSDDPGAESETPAAQGSDAPVELRATVWTANDDHLAVMNEIADEFVAANDAVSGVRFETLPFGEYTNVLSVQLAGGNPPDLGWLLIDASDQFIDAGVLADVGDRLRGDDAYDFEDITQRALEPWTRGDAVYGFPFSNSPEAVFFNADAFRAAGLPTPQEMLADGTWTWQALADAAATIASSEQMHGLVLRDFDFTYWPKLHTVWAAFDARPWDGDECTFDEPSMTQAMTFLHELVFDRGGHPGPGQAADFFAGEAAATVTQISRAGLLEDVDWEWGLVPLPPGPAGDAQIYGQAAWTVFSAGAQPELAADLLAHLTSEESSRKMAAYFPPPRERLLDPELLADANPLLTAEQLEVAVVDSLLTGSVPPGHPQFSRLVEAIRTELDAAWTPDADLDAVAANVCGAIEPLLTS